MVSSFYSSHVFTLQPCCSIYHRRSKKRKFLKNCAFFRTLRLRLSGECARKLELRFRNWQKKWRIPQKRSIAGGDMIWGSYFGYEPSNCRLLGAVANAANPSGALVCPTLARSTGPLGGTKAAIHSRNGDVSNYRLSWAGVLLECWDVGMRDWAGN